MSDAYIYTTPAGDHLRIEEHVDGFKVLVRDGQMWSTVTAPPEQRLHAAQALAGDEWQIVPKWTERENNRLEHENETLRAEVNKLKQQRIDLTAQLHDTEAQAAQPDRPEPVDPASVRVGDVVEVDYDAGEVPAYMVRGQVIALNTQDGKRQRPFAIQMPGHEFYPRVLDATVRVLHAAEPEPDEAAVEALADLLEATWAAGGMGAAEQARLLIRRGVTVDGER